MATIEYINGLTTEENISAGNFKKLFTIIENDGEGDCLFLALSQLLNGGTEHADIRKKICKFYKTFNQDETSHVEDSIEHRLAYCMMGDENDDDGREHKTAICEPGIWGSLCDAYVASILYECNIVVFKKETKKAKSYYTFPIINVDSTRRTIHIRLIVDEQHFEALIPKSTTAQKIKSPKKESPKKESPKKKEASPTRKRGRPKKESPKKESPKSTTAKNRAHIIERRTKALKIYKLIHDDEFPDRDEFNSWYESDYPDILTAQKKMRGFYKNYDEKD